MIPVTLTAPAQEPSWPKNTAPTQKMPSASSSSSTANPLAARPGQVRQQRVHVGDRVRGPWLQAGLLADRPDLLLRHRREHRLAGRRRVRDLALAERGVEPDAARPVDPLDEDRVALVVDRDPRGHLGELGQLGQQRPADVTERQLAAGDVAEPDQGRCPGVYLGPGRTSRSTPDAVSVRASASVVLLDVPSDPGQVAQRQTVRRAVGDDVDQPHGPGDAADRVPVRCDIVDPPLAPARLGRSHRNTPPAYKCSVLPNDNV